MNKLHSSYDFEICYVLLNFVPEIDAFFQLNHFMKIKKKYNSPVTEVMELKTEGIICASDDILQGIDLDNDVIPDMDFGWELEF